MTTALLNGPPRVSEAEVFAAISQWFTPGGDGWLYPRVKGTPLTRARVEDGRYSIERRRKPGTSWMCLVEADVAEFSEHGFETWVMGWALVA